MDLSTNVHHRLDLHSNFITGCSFPDTRISSLTQIKRNSTSVSFRTPFTPSRPNFKVCARLSTATAETSVAVSEPLTDIESLFSKNSDDGFGKKRSNKQSSSGISSGVKLENISKSYQGVTVLKDVSWEVKKGEKVGLVGVNGAGKTTQLRIITGQEVPDSGNVIKAKPNMKIAFLSQEFEVSMSRTVKEEFMSSFKEEMEISERLEKVQNAMERTVDDLELMGRLLDEFDLLQRRAQAVDLDQVDAKVSKLMPELGFSPEDSERLVASFSSGWQMRMSLGKILLQDPDLLLLDEPTNHLDLDTIEWLEGYLQNQDVPMVIISHDRAFLDQLCTKIVETDMGVSRTFEGNYSQYLESKAEWIESQIAAWEEQQKEIERTRDLISRLGAGANSGRASTAEKKLEKLLEEDQVEKPFQRKQMKIRFPERGRSGRSVVMVKSLKFSYEDKVLFDRANLSIERGEKVAILGPNGCGKSTLLKLIMGLEEPDGGEIVLGEHNVLPNYFEQNQAEALDLDKTVLQTVEEVAEDWRSDDIKGLLGRCNFKVDMLDRKVSLLSGGEKARLAFCKFMVKPSTLLVLDEPTNHLDIPSKEMLEDAIREYKGTVITVSHDRYFIKQIVNRVVEVKDCNLQDYRLHFYSNFITDSSFTDTRIFSLTQIKHNSTSVFFRTPFTQRRPSFKVCARLSTATVKTYVADPLTDIELRLLRNDPFLRPNLIHHNPSSISRTDLGLSSIKSNSRKCHVAKYNLQEQILVSTTTTMAWSEFARNVSGEWDGFAADFTPSGTPIELPEYVVPQAFRDWEVQVLDWQTQCPTLAQPHQDPTLNPKTDPPLISIKTILLLPTVGCEADAATRYQVQERIVGGCGGPDNSVPAAFAYQSTGSYVALWPIGHELQQFELEYCLVNPLDRESRVRILLLLAPNNPKLAIQRIRVFSELWYGPFRNGEQLGGCAIRESAFAATAPLKASQIVGIWQGPRVAATFDASDQSELPKQLLDSSTRNTVRDELHLLLLPKQLWCSFKDSKDGETSFEVGWVYTHGCAITSETIFSADAKLKEISIARETAAVEGV